MMEEKFMFFWKGLLSQWSNSPFEFEGMRFNTTEQFMMFCKAVLFKDYSIAKNIMEEGSPKAQKKLGRQVEGFDVTTWSKVARGIVYVGNYCKFSQNSDHNNALVETTGMTLVEASPYDRIWGIGLVEGDLKTLSRETWNGKNWLGEVLTKVRDDMAAQKKNESSFELAKILVDDYTNHWLGDADMYEGTGGFPLKWGLERLHEAFVNKTIEAIGADFES